MVAKKKLETAKKAYQKAKKTPAGKGKRFAALTKVAKAGGARDPKAVAAAIGRKKYGKKRFQEMAAKGKKRKAKKK